MTSKIVRLTAFQEYVNGTIEVTYTINGATAGYVFGSREQLQAFAAEIESDDSVFRAALNGLVYRCPLLESPPLNWELRSDWELTLTPVTQSLVVL